MRPSRRLVASSMSQLSIPDYSLTPTETKKNVTTRSFVSLVTRVERGDCTDMDMPRHEAIRLEGQPDAVLRQAIETGGSMLSAGEQETNPGTMRGWDNKVSEIFVVGSDAMELTGNDGGGERSGPGMAAHMPRGWCGVFHAVQPAGKTYAPFDAGDPA